MKCLLLLTGVLFASSGLAAVDTLGNSDASIHKDCVVEAGSSTCSVSNLKLPAFRRLVYKDTLTFNPLPYSVVLHGPDQDQPDNKLFQFLFAEWWLQTWSGAQWIPKIDVTVPPAAFYYNRSFHDQTLITSATEEGVEIKLTLKISTSPVSLESVQKHYWFELKPHMPSDFTPLSGAALKTAAESLARGEGRLATSTGFASARGR